MNSQSDRFFLQGTQNKTRDDKNLGTLCNLHLRPSDPHEHLSSFRLAMFTLIASDERCVIMPNSAMLLCVAS